MNDPIQQEPQRPGWRAPVALLLLLLCTATPHAMREPDGGAQRQAKLAKRGVATTPQPMARRMASISAL